MNCQKVVKAKATYTQTADSTSAAQHKTQGKRKADRWKIDCERAKEEHKTLLNFPSPKSLNYYWLLIFYFNIVHLCGPIIKIQGFIYVWHVHIANLPVFCCIAVRCVPTRSGPVLLGPVQSTAVRTH